MRLAIFSVLLLPAVAWGACPDAAVWAESFYRSHYSFYVGAPSSATLSKTTEKFGSLLKREADFSGGAVGHLDYDPWLGAQDGDIEKLLFQVESASGDLVVVSMQYTFSLNGTSIRERHTVHLVLSKEIGCWRLKDFVTPRGESLSYVYSQP